MSNVVMTEHRSVVRVVFCLFPEQESITLYRYCVAFVQNQKENLFQQYPKLIKNKSSNQININTSRVILRVNVTVVSRQGYKTRLNTQ